MTRTISRQDLQARIERKEPVIILEALPESYYLKGHLPGALNLPHERVPKLPRNLCPTGTPPS